MSKFQTTIIYKLECNKTKQIYIGSTIKTLKQRICCHISEKTRGCSSKIILQENDYNADILFKYPCNSDLEKRIKEQEFIDIYREYYGDLVINKQDAYVSLEKRREKDNLKSNKWVQANPEKRAMIDKKYNDAHKEEKAIKDKKRYDEQREQILEQNKQKVICECGAELTRGSLSQHRNRQIHQTNLNNL